MAEGPCAAGLQGRSHRGERRLAIHQPSTPSRPARRGRLEWNPPLHCSCCALDEPAFKKSDAIQTSDRDGEKRTVHFASMLRQCPDAMGGPSARQRADQGQTSPAPTPLRWKNNGTADDLSPSDPAENHVRIHLAGGGTQTSQIDGAATMPKTASKFGAFGRPHRDDQHKQDAAIEAKDHIQCIWRLLPA